MSETVSASDSQARERRPRPKNRETDEDRLCGHYQRLYKFGNFDQIDELKINKLLPATSSHTMTPYNAGAWKPCDFSPGDRSATFYSTDEKLVAYVSLCEPFELEEKRLLIVVYSLPLLSPDHESHAPGEQQPTGVWIGTSGPPCPPDC